MARVRVLARKRPFAGTPRDRNRPHAGAADAAPRPRSAARRREPRPRHPRPPARRHRRELLAVPPLRRRRGGAAHRLAPLRPRRPALCARTRMGNRADASGSGSIAPPRWATPRIWRRRPRSSAPSCSASPSPTPSSRPASGSACWASWRPAPSRRIAETMAQALVADRALARRRPAAGRARSRRCDEAILISDFLSPVRDIAAIGRGHLGPRRARPSGDDRRSRSRRPSRSRARPSCTISRMACRCASAMPSPGAMPTANGSRSTEAR